jgi:adenylate cyclase
MGSEINGNTMNPSFFKSRPIRVDISTAFTGLLVITVLVIILYGYHRNSKAVLEISEDIIHEVRELVIKEATLFLKPVASMVRLSATLAASFDLSIPDDAFETYAITVMKEFSQIEIFSMADEKGNFMMLKNMPDSTIATKIINRNETPETVTWKYRNISGEVIRTEKTEEVDYDPRVRPWYKGAKNQGETYWTDLYIFYTDKVPGITASHPVITGDGQFLGVFGLDIELGRLSEFLKRLRIGKNGIAFIMSGNGDLIAYPGVSHMVTKQEKGLRSAHVEELGIHWISTFYREHKKSQAKRFTFESDGTRYIGTLVDFPRSFAGDWKLSIIVPEDDFIGPIKKTRQVVITISIIVLLIAIGFAALLSHNISKPILHVAKETERIKDFKLEGELEVNSYIREIQTLNAAMKRMKASLRSFTRYAPEEIVREVVAKGREAILGGEKREVTLLFCDLRGFTKFSEKTRAEEVVSILNDHFDVMVRLISDHQGFVIDFLGDSVFAAFGALGEDPHHARHGVRCAVEMQVERLRLNEENRAAGLPILEMGIGLNTGACVVGNMGSTMRIKYGVLGHAVNLGARIESFTVGGQVMISAETHEIVKDQFVTQGPFEVFGKGIKEAIRIWEVREVKGEPSLRLPPVVPGLVELPQPVPVTFRFMRGKQLDSKSHQARLTRLAEMGCEIRSEQWLELFSAVQLQIPGNQMDKVVTIDGKVVGADKEKGAFTVRFSPMDAIQTEAIRLILETS